MQTGLGEVPTTGESQRLFILVEMQIEVCVNVPDVCGIMGDVCEHHQQKHVSMS